MDKSEALMKAKEYFITNPEQTLTGMASASKRLFGVKLGTDDIMMASESEDPPWPVQKKRIMGGKCPHCGDNLPSGILARSGFDPRAAIEFLAENMLIEMKEQKLQGLRIDPQQVNALLNLITKGGMTVLPSSTAKTSMDRVIEMLGK